MELRQDQQNFSADCGPEEPQSWEEASIHPATGMCLPFIGKHLQLFEWG